MEWSVATIGRLVGLLAQVTVAVIIIRIARPKKGEVAAAFAAGGVCAISDWIYEAVAFKKGLWFCYGGIQMIKLGVFQLDFLHVPIDMVVGFVFYGVIISFASIYRELLDRSERFSGRLNPRYDLLRVIAVLILLSLGGAVVDFASKNLGIWQNGPTWTYFHTAFLAWLPLNSLTVVVFHVTRRFLMPGKDIKRG